MQNTHNVRHFWMKDNAFSEKEINHFEYGSLLFNVVQNDIILV